MQHKPLSNWLLDHIKDILFFPCYEKQGGIKEHSEMDHESDRGYNLLVSVLCTNDDENATDYIIERKFLFNKPVTLTAIARKVEELHHRHGDEFTANVLSIEPLMIVETN